jgi:hypothetical protein
MKKLIILLIVTITIAWFAGCAQFPTTFERVESDMVRTLDFMYEPCEAAPGDTVTMVAHFSGKPFNISDIKWSISYNNLTNAYGQDTAFDIKPFIPLAVFDSSYVNETMTFKIRIPIPKDIMLQNCIVNRDWSEFPVAVENSRGFSMNTEADRKNLISMFDVFSLKAMEWGKLLNNNPQSQDSLLEYDPLYPIFNSEFKNSVADLCFALTATIRLTAKIGNEPTIISRYVVRYNSRFSQIADLNVFLNRNPVVDSMVIYKVKGVNLRAFDKSLMQFETFKLNSTNNYLPANHQATNVYDTIALTNSDEYTYFLSVFMDESQRDRAMTMDRSILKERYDFTCLYKVVEQSSNEILISEYPVFQDANTPELLIFYPPKNNKISKMALWVTIDDEIRNVPFRPTGSAVYGASLYFK